MAKHSHGSMDIEVQEKTFDGFVSIVAKSAAFIVVFLIFLAIVNG
ncbi:aa3-type cytochrome c oxidase subunit IV [Palleronia caenipelagi]|uniref:Aa3-type cytochrome c oxidase subunit IV n=1 Tax=Palleronia caenipelagi TaxID=2489174 RepID=A0A547Q2T6_9RHOB|nr:aa3-type cytochrome c oxidase subunit IV [Palleronia caenipelagi]TRD20706.1 aa3-type cytochrome c oxidase subunit IV [Palleronia caenipelagi]